MRKTRRSRVVLSFILAVVMIISLVPAANAAFPLRSINDELVADANTLYVALLEQDPDTNMITVSIQVYNGNAVEPLVIASVGSVLSFSSAVAPFAYDPANTDPSFWTRLYNGPATDDVAGVIRQYAKYQIPLFNVIGSAVIQNDGNGRFIGGKVSAINNDDTITIDPLSTVTFLKYYFMPVNGADKLNVNMFSFETIYTIKMIMLSTFIANGSRYMVSDQDYAAPIKEVSPSSFKMHYAQNPPTGLYPINDEPRGVGGYNSDMQWSYDANGPFTDGAPVIKDEEHSIFVRYRGTDYLAGSGLYGAYKKTLPSDPVEVEFRANFYSCKDDVSLTKTSQILPPVNPDGFLHVGDTVEYTVIAKNDGHVRSTWANAVMTDTIPAGVTFAHNVRINGALQTVNVGYTFIGGVLRVPLGDIPGGTEKRVTFNVTIDASAAGNTIINAVRVAGTDGDGGDDVIKDAEDNGGDGVDVRDVTAPPDIDTITEGDTTISGDGVPGAQIVVTLPGSVVLLPVTVDGSGRWTVNVPPGTNLIAGDKVEAVQKQTGKDDSSPAETTVVARPDHVELSSKTYRNLNPRPDGTRRVGDTLEYKITVKNDGDVKSLWEDVEIIDALPEEVDFVPGSVKIDGAAPGAGTTVNYDLATHTLTVTIAAIPGQVTREVTFEVVINNKAYGVAFRNVAKVDGKDVPEDPEDPTPGQTPQPDVDEINEGDRVITGEGLPGATIEITFPNYIHKRYATVRPDGTWTVEVPSDHLLEEGQIVTVIQTLDPDDPSEPLYEPVLGKKPVIPYMEKTFKNLTSTDGQVRVGDSIEYSIKVGNSGSPKSYWTGAVLTDIIPVGVTLVSNTVLVNNNRPTFTTYDSTTRVLQVTLWRGAGDIGIQGGTFVTVTFAVTVDPGSYGKNITNTASVLGYENGDEDKIIEDDTDDGGGFEVVDQSDTPDIDDVTRGDKKIRGRGNPGSTIIVTLDDGTELPPVKVDDNGDWEVDIGDNEVDTGDVITAVQIDPDKDPSDPAEKIVDDKAYRSVRGYVWPLAVSDKGLPGFMDRHAVVVELRQTYKTVAPSNLSTKAILIDYDRSIGEFVFDKVPFGTYILYIKRPGYLVRCMEIVVSPSDDDVIFLEPPSTTHIPKNGRLIFDLWWGDVNNDFRVDNDDVLLVMEQLRMGISAYDDAYNPACDMNADGRPDNDDILLIMEHWDKYVRDYPGGENINYAI